MRCDEGADLGTRQGEGMGPDMTGDSIGATGRGAFTSGPSRVEIRSPACAARQGGRARVEVDESYWIRDASLRCARRRGFYRVVDKPEGGGCLSGRLVMVVGKSRVRAKSTGLRNFEDRGEAAIFNLAGKPLPFRKHREGRPMRLHSRGEPSAPTEGGHCSGGRFHRLMRFSSFTKAKESGLQQVRGHGRGVRAPARGGGSRTALRWSTSCTIPTWTSAATSSRDPSAGMFDGSSASRAFPIVIACEVRDGRHVFSVGRRERGIAKRPWLCSRARCSRRRPQSGGRGHQGVLGE